jgi:hypothetical protein
MEMPPRIPLASAQTGGRFSLIGEKCGRGRASQERDSRRVLPELQGVKQHGVGEDDNPSENRE